MLLCSHPDGALVPLGVECGTYVFMSRGLTKRTILTPMGFVLNPCVQAANTFTSRQGGSKVGCSSARRFSRVGA